MSYLKAVILGVVQGLTEFLPVSSSGHLVLLQNRMGLDPDSPEMLAFDVVSHLGTLLAVGVVFSPSAFRLFSSRKHALRILGLGLIATVVTAVVGLTFQEWFKSFFARENVWLVGLAFMVTGVVLFATRFAPRPRKGWRKFSFGAAAVVGLAQAVAIIPGISRSGATISVAIWLGLRRRWAAQFSFLIAAPAIIGATILELKDFSSMADSNQIADFAGPLAVGGLVAFVIGLASLMLLLKMVQQARLHWFSYYLWVLGGWVIIKELLI